MAVSHALVGEDSVRIAMVSPEYLLRPTGNTIYSEIRAPTYRTLNGCVTESH